MVPSDEGSLMWTLDEIGRLVSRERQPVRDADQRRPPDPAAIRDRRLLGLPARARSRRAWCSPPRSACAPTASGACACASPKGWPAWWPNSSEPQIVADATTHPRFKYFREAGEDPVPLLPRRPDHRPRPAAGRARRADDRVARLHRRRRADADDGRRRSWRRSSAKRGRSDSSSRRPTSGSRALAQNLWWSWDHDATSLFRELDPVLWRELRQQPDRAAAADVDRASSRSAPRSWRCTAASTTRYRRLQEYLHSHADLGRPPRRRALGAARSPTSPPSSACTSRCPSTRAASASWPATTSRARRTSASRSSASASTTTRATSGSGSTRDGWQHEDYLDVDHRLLPMQPALADGVPGARSPSRHAPGPIRGARVASGGRPQHAAAARFERRGQPSGGSRADRAALRRRQPRTHPAGAAARRRRRARAGRAGHLAWRRCTSTKGTAPLRRWSCVRQRMEAEGIDACEAMRRVAPQIVFTTHTPVPAGHDRFPAALVEEHLGPLRDALGLDRDTFMGLGRVDPHDRQRTSSA